ncbi:MAG: hypothetical protein JXR07_04625 [Reichenbachiella sp.]
MSDNLNDRKMILEQTSIHPKVGLENDLFGRFLGDWEFDLSIFDFDGSKKDFKGKWHFHRICDGMAMQDHWIVPNSDGHSLHESGTAVRMFDFVNKNWKVTWLGPIQNQYFVFNASQKEDRIVLEETGYAPLKMRWVFYDISDHQFQWKSEILMPDLNKWFTNYHMYVKRP